MIATAATVLANGTAPIAMIQELAAPIERARTSLPGESSIDCWKSGNLETVGTMKGSGPCGLQRVAAAHLALSKLQAKFAATKDKEQWDTSYNAVVDGQRVHSEYGQRLAQLVQLRRALHGEGGEDSRVRVACEIGFNVGHGSSILLEGTQVEVVHSFDLLANAWSTAAVQMIQHLFPGRLVMHQGNSQVTVQRYADEVKAGRAPRCDLWYIDGLHTGDGPRKDMVNALASSHNGTIILADDCTRHWVAVLNGFRTIALAGSIRAPVSANLKAKHFEGGGHGGSGWCLGIAVKPPSRLASNAQMVEPWHLGRR